MRNVLITGCRRGLGKILYEYLLDKGFFILGTTRNIDSFVSSKNQNIFYLDLTDSSSICRLTTYFIESNINIDAIIHNSGIAYLDPADVLEDDELRHTFDINFFGPIQLTKLMLPILKKQIKSNLIFISSVVSVDHWPYLGVYAASKAAMEAVAFEWAVLLKKWNIYVSVLQPNPLPTDMQILRSRNCKSSPYPELSNRQLEWESTAELCEIVNSILNDSSPCFQYQTGIFSRGAVQRYIIKDAYEDALKIYQKSFGNKEF